MSTYEERLKGMETMLSPWITDKIGEHLNYAGVTVNRYFVSGPNHMAITDFLISTIADFLISKLKTIGFSGIWENDPYWFDTYNRELLARVSYREGSVYILLFSNEEGLDESIRYLNEAVRLRIINSVRGILP